MGNMCQTVEPMEAWKVKYPTLSNHERILLATEEGNAEVVEHYLREGGDANRYDISDGDTLLMRASKNNNQKLVKMLLEHGADPNLTLYGDLLNDLDQEWLYCLPDAYRKQSALSQAIINNNWDVVQLLLSSGAYPNVVIVTDTVSQMSAVELCVSKNKYKILELLLNRNCAIYTIVNSYQIANSKKMKDLLFQTLNKSSLSLVCTVQHKLNHISKLLLDSDIDTEYRTNMGETALTIAVKNGNLEAVQLLLQHGANTDTDDLVTAAAMKQQTELLHSLLSHNVSTDNITDGEMLLQYGVRNCYVDLVDLMVRYKKAKFTCPLFKIDREDALVYSCKLGYDDITYLILKALCDGDDNSDSTILTGDNNNSTTLQLFEHILKDNSQCKDLQLAALIYAVKQGNGDVVNSMISNGVDLQLKTTESHTVLFYATEHENMHIVKLLLEHRTNMNCFIEDKHILMHALRHGYDKIARQLVQNYSLVVTRDEVEQLPLHLAIQHRCFATVELMLQCGVSANCYTADGLSALAYAVQCGNVESVTVLLQHGASVNVDIDDEPVLRHAVRKGYDKMVDILIQHCASIDVNNVEGLTLLQLAVISGNVDSINTLIKVTNQTELVTKYPLWALENGYVEFYNALIQHGVNVNDPDNIGRTALFIAALKNDIDMAAWLLQQGATVDVEDKRGSSPILICSVNGHIELMRILAAHSESLGLETAAKSGDMSILGIVLDLADVGLDIRFHKRETALHIACRKKHSEMVQMLCDNDADVTAKDLWNRTPLHEAALSGCDKCMEAVLNNGKDVIEEMDFNGWTALHFSAWGAFDRCVRLLIESGANAQVRDKFGLTPLDYGRFGLRHYHRNEHHKKDCTSNIRLGVSHKNILQLLSRSNVITCSMYTSPYEINPFKQTVTFVDQIRAYVNSQPKCKDAKYEQRLNEDMMSHWALTLLTKPGIGKVVQHNQSNVDDAMDKAMRQLMERLVQWVRRYDGRINLNVQAAGSVTENTKIGLPDDYDFHLYLSDLEGCVDVEKELEDTVVLKLNTVHHPWTFAFNEHGTLLAEKIHQHIYMLICKALSEQHIYEDLPLMWKFMDKDEVHFEWRGDNYPRIAIRVNFALVVKLYDWWPSCGMRNETCLLSGPAKNHGVTLFIRANSWVPTSSLQEAHIMANMASIPKLAYVLAKIINSIVEYSDEEAPYRVKSYDLKNAMMLEVRQQLANEMTTLHLHNKTFPIRKRFIEEFPLGSPEITPCAYNTGDILTAIAEWTKRICGKGLQRLLKNEKHKLDSQYYYGFSHSKITRTTWEKLNETLRASVVIVDDFNH